MALKTPPKQLILIRGLPGSGKTTLGKVLSEALALRLQIGHGWFTQSATVGFFEPDMYFNVMKTAFDRTKLPEAKSFCINKVRDAMYINTNIIIVTDRFLRVYDMGPYEVLADLYHYSVQEIVCSGKFMDKHPIYDEDEIEKMRVRFQHGPLRYSLGTGERDYAK